MGCDRIDQEVRSLPGGTAPGADLHAIFNARAAGDKGCPRGSIHRGANANPRPHLCHSLRKPRIIRPAVIGRVQRDAEAIRIACFGQKPLGAIGVKAPRLHGRVIAKSAFRQPLRGGSGRTLHHAVHQRIAVDRHGKRAPDAHILPRVHRQGSAVIIRDQRRAAIARIIGGHIDGAQARHFRNSHARVAPKPGQIAGWDLFNDVHIAGEQGRGARRIIQQKALIGPRPRFLRPPIAFMPRQFHAITGTIGQHPIRPGADGGLARIEILAAGTFRRVAGNDANRCQIKRKQRMRCASVQDERMRIRRFHLGDSAQKPTKATRAIRHAGLYAGKGEDHVIGGERLAIMPGDITPELHFPNRIGHHTPAFREARLRAGAFIAFHEAVKNVMRERVIRPDIVEMRVNGGDRRAEADRQRLRAWRADGQGQRNQRCQHGFGGVVHCSLPEVLREKPNAASRFRARVCGTKNRLPEKWRGDHFRLAKRHKYSQAMVAAANAVISETS